MKSQKPKKSEQESILILHDIRSIQNVGAIFRTADAVGIRKIYLTGYTPAPLDRFGRIRKDLVKSALGAEKFVLWEQKKSIASLLRELKKENFLIIAIEQDKNSVDYRKVELQDKNAFLVGPEVTGIPQSLLKGCDIVAEIPMHGQKESLNVSVATGIALFAMIHD